MKNLLKYLSHFVFKTLFAKMLMRPVPPGKFNKVLISAYTGLGHIILKTPLIKKIEELYPGCKIYVIAENAIQTEFPYSGHIGTKFVLSEYEIFILRQDSRAFKKIIFFLKLRKEKIDVVFLPFDASPKTLIRGSILAGIPIRVGHVFDHVTIPSYYYTHKVQVRTNIVRNQIDLNLDLLQALSQKSFQRGYRPFIDMNYETTILETNELQKNAYICLQMGGKSGFPTTTRWPESHFQSLIKKLLDAYPDLKIVALGDMGDSMIVNRICEGIESNRLINLSGKTNLGETKSLIASCKFLVCHDSGLLHLGNALRKNIIALYGPSNPDFYAFNMSSCHIIQKKCDCSPCLGLFPRMSGELAEEEAALKCPVPECMKKITVNDVYEKCVELLNMAFCS